MPILLMVFILLQPLCGRRSSQAAHSIRGSTVALAAAASRNSSEAKQSSGSPGPATPAPKEAASAAVASTSEASPWHVQLDGEGHQQQPGTSTASPSVELSSSLSGAPAAPSPWSSFDDPEQQQKNIAGSSNHAGSQHSVRSSGQPPGEGVSRGGQEDVTEQASASSSSQGFSHGAGASGAEQEGATQSSSSGWEMVDQQVVGVVGPSGGVETVETVRNLVYRLGGEQGRTGAIRNDHPAADASKGENHRAVV